MLMMSICENWISMSLSTILLFIFSFLKEVVNRKSDHYHLKSSSYLYTLRIMMVIIFLYLVKTVLSSSASFIILNVYAHHDHMLIMFICSSWSYANHDHMLIMIIFSESSLHLIRSRQWKQHSANLSTPSGAKQSWYSLSLTLSLLSSLSLSMPLSLLLSTCHCRHHHNQNQPSASS